MIKKHIKHEIVFVVILFFINVLLFFLPTGFEHIQESSTREKGLIISVDNSQVFQKGIVKTGSQYLKVKILSGRFKGQEIDASNNLRGQLELDKMFSEGDKALCVVGYAGNNISYVNVIDHYRINIELLLFLGFILLLVIFAGWIGVKSVLSFIFTIFMIWKILIPSFLKGYPPVLVSLFVVTILIGVTIYLVAGITKKAFVAFMGAFLGILLTCILALIFGKLFKIHGAVVPFSETLLYSGFGNLDLTSIFLSGIFIASAGALMDVTMDISVSVSEVVSKKPDITTKEAISSGMSVAKAVTGTMTTTLLLAYSGSYTALFMVFMAQGTPVMNIFNLTYIAAEILHTVVGSFGLVLVAPITAILAGVVYTKKDFFIHESNTFNE